MPKLDELSGTSVNLSDQLSEMVEFKKTELARLQSEVLSEQATLAKTKSENEEAKRQAVYDRQVEQEKFKASLQAQAESLQGERKSLERLDLEVNSRLKDVQELEAKAAPIQAAMQKLTDERLAIEQQRVRLEDLRAESDRLANATSAAHEEVAQLKASLTAQQTRVQTRATEQDQQQAQLDLREKEVAVQLENLTALKVTIDPKLEEVRKLQDQAAAEKGQADTIRQDILAQSAALDKQKADLNILSSQLQAKAESLTDFSASLKRAEAELRIKVQQAGVAVTVPEAPTS